MKDYGYVLKRNSGTYNVLSRFYESSTRPAISLKNRRVYKKAAFLVVSKLFFGAPFLRAFLHTF